jgi:hypothetical protein
MNIIVDDQKLLVTELCKKNDADSYSIRICTECCEISIETLHYNFKTITSRDKFFDLINNQKEIEYKNLKQLYTQLIKEERGE